MDFTLCGIPGVCFYIDDILVVADGLDDHHSRLQSVLQRLADGGLRINTDKSV